MKKGKSKKHLIKINNKKYTNYSIINDSKLQINKGIKACLNVDKLTICYTVSDEVYLDLMNTNYVNHDTFILSRYTDTSKLFSDCFTIQCLDTIDGELKWYNMGLLKFNGRFAEESNNVHYVWIYVNNETLYRPMYPGVSVIAELAYISDVLQLQINNITSLDVAFDCNINFARRIRNAVFDSSLNVILNGKLKNNPKEVLNEIIYLQKGNQKRITDLSIYVTQKKKKDGIRLCVYDKTKESQLTNKSYILEWFGSKQNLYRTEIRLKAQHLKEYFRRLPNFNLDIIYPYLADQNFLLDLFITFSNRLLRFKNKSNGQIYSILDI